MIDLSFIIPVYNLEKYICATFDSILNNKFDFEYEIIAINDGSKDNSNAVIGEYVEKYDNIHLFNNTNHGVSYTRNFGIDKANGKYICFVDGDDTIDTNTYADMMHEMQKGKYDFVQCNYVSISDQCKTYSQFCETTRELQNKDDFFELFFSPQKIIHNSCWGKIINKEFISSVRFDANLVVSEDQKFIFEMLCKAKKILLMNGVGYHYYQRENSAMHSMNIKKCKNKINVLQSFLESCPCDNAKKYINYQKGLALIEFYNISIDQQPEECTGIRNELKNIEDVIRPILGKKDKIKLMLIFRMNFVYKLAIKLLYGNKHTV